MNNYEVKGFLKKDDKKLGFIKPIVAKNIKAAYDLVTNAFKCKVIIFSIKEIKDILEIKL